MIQKYVDTPAGQLHYVAEGNGNPLLLIHQTSLSCEEYSEVMPILGKRYGVLALDLPGHGNSYMPPVGFRIEDHAKAVAAFLDALGIRKSSIVGHHVGARIAVEFAAAWPERVDKLVLSGCPWYSKEELRALPHHPLYQGIEVTEDGSFVPHLWQSYRARWKAAPKPLVLCRLVATHLSTLARSMDIHEAALRHDIDPRLRLVKSPALLVAASGDVFVSKLETVSRMIPGSHAVVIEGAGFFVALEKPREFAETILDFLEKDRP